MKCERQVRQNLSYSATDSFFFSVMVGAGETFLPAFALAIGLGGIATGLISSIPFLGGAVIQLVAPRLARMVGSYRLWVVTLATMQGLCFLPLVYFALQGTVSAPVLFSVVTLYWACGMGTGPMWNTWMSRLVPHTLRPRYFALRSRIGQIGILLGLVGAGLLLEYAKGVGHELEAFAIIFIVACTFRMVSCWYLSRKTEPAGGMREQRQIKPLELFRKLRFGKDGRFLLFLMSMYVCVSISGPFFNPFMLKHLGHSYHEYMWLIALSFITKVVLFPVVGHWCKTLGAFRLVQIGAIGCAISPLLWVFSDNYVYLAVTQVWSGAVWALFDLGVMVAFFDTLRDEERSSFLALYNFSHAGAIFVGTLIGAQLLSWLGEGMAKSYHIIFAISCVGRFGSLLFLEKLAPTVFVPERILTRILALRPNQGGVMSPVLAPMEEAPAVVATSRPDEAAEPSRRRA